LKYDDIAILYRHNALMEYISNIDGYDEIIGEHLPPNFKVDGRRLREKLKHV